MDMTYATIPIFSQLRKLYREAHMKFMVRSLEKPKNSPLYSFHTYLDSFILYNDEFIDEQELEDKNSNNRVEPTNPNIITALDTEENKGGKFEQCAELKN